MEKNFLDKYEFPLLLLGKMIDSAIYINKEKVGLFRHPLPLSLYMGSNLDSTGVFTPMNPFLDHFGACLDLKNLLASPLVAPRRHCVYWTDV